MTDHFHSLAALLDSARRRHLVQLIVQQTGVALGAAFAGAILLLLVGTQILDWYWLVALFAASFGVGVWRTIHRIPSRYELAQILDAKLHLNDTLSTAFCFSSGERAADPDLVISQRRRAERLAGSIDAGAVFPVRIPKVFYAAGGIALVAFGMFAIRYGVTHSLDLKPSLVKIAFDTFWKQEDTAPSARKSPLLQRNFEEQLKKLGINVGSQAAETKQQDASQAAMNTMDVAGANNAEAGENDQAKANRVAGKEPQEGEGENSLKSEKASGTEDANGEEQSGEKAQGSAQNGKQDGQKNADNQASDKSSMMDRMKDAMSNLLNKLKMQPKSGESQQMAKDSKGGGKGQQSQKGSPSPGKPQNGSDSPDQQGQQEGQGDKSQSAQGKSGEKSADQKASQDAKSGIGKDDGDKSAREAEQLAAMGKISEILGKRAQSLSGELMVEVAGGNQQLKTAYSGSVGKHAEAGGEITRDEVPLIYRDFVQQYFEQIRKTPAAKKAE